MDDQEFIQEGRGRSARKREAKAVEDLARQLVELPEAEVAKLPLDDELRRELELARATRGHNSRRRQLKYFAGCLRRDEDQRATIAGYLDCLQDELAKGKKAFHRLEDLRDRLCDKETYEKALAEIGIRWPQADLQKLASLARSVHDNRDKKAAREIFRRLRQAQEA